MDKMLLINWFAVILPSIASHTKGTLEDTVCQGGDMFLFPRKGTTICLQKLSTPRLLRELYSIFGLAWRSGGVANSG